MSDLSDFYNSTGISGLDWRAGIMLLLGLGFVFVAIVKGREPYVLLPIGLGVIIANLPDTGMTDFVVGSDGNQESGIFGIVLYYGLTFWDNIYFNRVVMSSCKFFVDSKFRQLDLIDTRS